MISPTLVLHIGGGVVAIVAGYAALVSRKGGRSHRLAGNVFFFAMLVMAATASIVAALHGQRVNTTAGAITCYLVWSGWWVVKERPGAVARYHGPAAVFGLLVSLTGFVFGVLGDPTSPDVAPVLFIFGALAAWGAVMDWKVIRRGGLAGPERLRRHIWRMCTALFIATGSFFFGQADEIPRSLHGPHLTVLAFAPLAALVFWMLKTRARRPPHQPVAA